MGGLGKSLTYVRYSAFHYAYFKIVIACAHVYESRMGALRFWTAFIVCRTTNVQVKQLKPITRLVTVRLIIGLSLVVTCSV